MKRVSSDQAHVILSSSSSNSESCWEEKSNDVDDSDINNDALLPPPVIFAGVSSPGRCRLPRQKRGSSVPGGSHRKIGANQRCLNQAARTSTSCQNKSLPTRVLRDDLDLVTPVPATATVRRPSITNQQSLFLTPSCHAEIQRRSRRSAKLKNQVAELEAALDHAKGKEAVLEKNFEDLRERLVQKDRKLEEKQKVIETLEKEHRGMKKHFRELVESTLDSSSCTTSSVDVEAVNDFEMFTKKERDGVSHDLEDVEMSDKCHDDLQRAPQILSDHESSQFSTSRSATVCRTSFEQATVTRTRSVPPLDRKASTRDQDLKWRLRETEELLESLRGTNGYAQQVLKRNSALERRCDELENLHDSQLREVYDEFGRCRSEKIKSATLADRYRIEAAEARQQVGELHADLQKLHEKMGSYQDVSLELAENKEALIDAQEALAAHVAKSQKAANEWEAEKQHLLRNIELLKRLQEATGENSSEDSTNLNERNNQLEEKLSETLKKSKKRISEIESEMQELRSKVRTLTVKYETEVGAVEEQTARNAELEKSISSMHRKFEDLRAELSRSQQENNQLALKAAETQELKIQLKIERERNNAHASQIAQHVQSIEESNKSFAELVERNNALDKLLQRLQKEKEDLVNENMKTNNRVYGEADNYRKKCEQGIVEVQRLKKQLSEYNEKLRLTKEKERLDKDAELRRLKDSFAAQRLEHDRRADQEMAKLMAQHSKEMTDLRKEKDAKLESCMKHYESSIENMRNVHELKLKDLHEAKEKVCVKSQEEINQRVLEVEQLWSKRIGEEKSRHEKEIQAITASYQTSFQNELKKKNEEIEKLRRSLDSNQAEIERVQFMAERMVEDEKLQRTQVVARMVTESQHSVAAALEKEKDNNRAALAVLKTEHSRAIKSLEEVHSQTLQTLDRKIAVLNEKLHGTVAEREKLLATISAREEALNAARTEISKAIENGEVERKKEAADAAKEYGELKAQLEIARQTIHHLKEHESSDDEISRLNERIELLMLHNTELEQKYKKETDLLKSELDTKAERLQTLQSENLHTKSVLKRNSELEAAAAKEIRESGAALKAQRQRAASLEAEIINLKNSIAVANGESRQLKSDIEQKQGIIDRLSKKMEEMTERVAYLKEVETKVESLSSETISLRRQLEATRDAPEKDSENTRYRERLREMGDELLNSTAKCRRLEEEISRMKDSVEETSNATLELQHAKAKVESLDEMIDILKQRAMKKDEIITDLKEQLNLLMLNRNSDSRESDPENEKKLEKLAKRCQDLDDLQQIFEQEKRSYEHRIELDRQVLTQKIDQKDQQLELLLETNKRAELCFARNVELEEMLLRLKNEMDGLRSAGESISAQRNEIKVDEMALSAKVAMAAEATIRENKLCQELDAARNEMLQRDGEIRLLQTRISEMRSTHIKQLEELNSRLKLATIEHSLNAAGIGDDTLIQSLIDRVSQLQDEVRRLRKGRDAQLITLQAENESLKVAANATPGRDHYRDGDRTNKQYLLSQVDVLEVERDALRLRVNELIEALRASSSIEIHEVEELKQRNLDLQSTVDKLTEIVGDQKRTLDLANRYADEALKQNGSLRELTGKLDASLYDDNVLENILKRNLELESLLHELREQNDEIEKFKVSRSSTSEVVVTTTSSPNARITSHTYHGQSRNPHSTIVTSTETQLNAKHLSPNTTPSTSAGESSQLSPSPSVQCPTRSDSIFTLSGHLDDQQTSDVTRTRLPPVSLYKSIRASLPAEKDDGEVVIGRSRCKRPRLSDTSRDAYRSRTRSKTASESINSEQNTTK